jgi:F0F1-type ATP synthase assembly protein I
MPSDPPENGPRVAMSFLFIGSEMASSTLIGLLFDYLLGTLPWFTIVCTFLGLGAAFFHLIKFGGALARKAPKQPDGGNENGRNENN